MSPDNSLILEFVHPNRVVFKRSNELNVAHWSELLRWWSTDLTIDEKQLTFETTLENYLTKRAWFKVSWREKGRSVTVADSLKKAVKVSTNIAKQFEDALLGKIKDSTSKLNLKGLKRNLTEQQKYNVASSLNISNGANFSVPGAGKTTATLALWNHLVQEKQIEKLLVVCPISVFDSWIKDELVETFLKPPTAQKVDTSVINPHSKILVVNYEKLENSEILNKLMNWIAYNKVMLVVDEAHRVKGGGNSVRWTACKQLADICSRVELLTGTPMPQGYKDIRNLFKLSWSNLPASSLSDAKLSALKPGGVFVRTTKHELNLPPIEIKEISIEPTDKQKQIYSSLRRVYTGLFRMSSNNRAFLAKKGAAVMTLIAAASNPGLIAGREVESAYLELKWPPQEISTNNELMEVVNNYVSLEIPPKYEWLARFIKKSAQEGKKTLVWSSFVGNIRSLERLLSPFQPAVVYGGIALDERRKSIERFRNNPNCHVLITNPQTLGEGISLHKTCNQAVYVDRTFNAVHYLQSLDRIHRLGLKSDVITNVYVLITKNSIDNRIDLRLKTKIDRMATSLNDDSLNISSYVTYDDHEELLNLGFDQDDEDDLFDYLRCEN